jgi:type 1 glutamine amidotransferase
MPGIAYREVIHPEVNQLYDSILIDQVDVLLFYDMFQEIDDTEKAAFMKLLEEGKGMIFLHHSLANYQEWEEFEKVIGGRYILSDQGGSTYRHDVEMPVHVVDKKHPLTRGVDDFMIHDEVYGNFRVLPTVSPLLTTTHPESSDTIAWTNKYGDSRIVYIQLGHDHHAYEDPNFRILLKQAIDWVQ